MYVCMYVYVWSRPRARATVPAILGDKKKAPNPYLVSKNCRYCRASERSCFLSTRTHLSLSLYVYLLSFCSARTRTSFSLSASAQVLFSAWQRRAELNSVKHGYYVACYSNFACKYSQNHSTAIVLILWVFYLIVKQFNAIFDRIF